MSNKIKDIISKNIKEAIRGEDQLGLFTERQVQIISDLNRLGLICQPKLYNVKGEKMADKKYQEKLDMLIYELKRELATGIHTYHTCPHCDTYSTRAGKCAVCLVVEFKKG